MVLQSVASQGVMCSPFVKVDKQKHKTIGGVLELNIFVLDFPLGILNLINKEDYESSNKRMIFVIYTFNITKALDFLT